MVARILLYEEVKRLPAKAAAFVNQKTVKISPLVKRRF